MASSTRPERARYHRLDKTNKQDLCRGRIYRGKGLFCGKIEGGMKMNGLKTMLRKGNFFCGGFCRDGADICD
jgi:hypothetical protein